MGHKTIIKVSLAMILLFSFSYAAIAQDIFVNNGIIYGSCNDFAQVLVSLHDTTNDVWWQKNATVSEPIPDIFIYNATFNGVANNANFDVFIYGSGRSPCRATGNATTTAVTGSALAAPTTVSYMNVTLVYNMWLTSPLNNSINSNDTSFTWGVDFEHTPIFNLVIDDNPDLSSPVRNITSIAATTYTLSGAEILPDGDYYWNIEMYNQSNNAWIQNSYINNFTVSDGSVTISNLQPTGWQNDSSVLLSLTTSDDAECRYSYSSSAYSAKTVMSNTGGTSHSSMVALSSDGGNNIYVMCNSSFGVLTGETVHTIFRDMTSPDYTSAVVEIDNGSAFTTNTTLYINWSGFSDALSGIAGYYYGFSQTERYFTNSTSATLTNAQEGGEVVYVWPVDNAGNIGNYAWDMIIVDTSAPVISVVSQTNLNKYTTTDVEVHATVTDDSPLNGTYPRIRYKKWDQPYSSWFNMTLNPTDYSFTIPQAPDSWQSHIGESLIVEIFAQDIHGFSSMLNTTDLIEDASTPPVIYDPGTFTVAQDQELNFSVYFFDADSDPLTYSSTKGTMTKVNNTYGIFKWTPTNADVGTNFVVISANDGSSTVNRTVRITVTDVNDPPVFGTDNQVSYDTYVYHVFSAQLNATDSDGDNITYSSNSSLFPVSTTTGEIRSYPGIEDKGTHSVNFTVSDGSSEAKIKFTINVLYCGDQVCSDSYEDCNTCELDCGKCDNSDSAAIIIYPRNCLDKTMTIKAVNLVERATCSTKGLIVDNKEVCGNLSDHEVYVERIVNNTYEQTATLMTDEYGIVTFTPSEMGEYRITLKGFDIQTHFTSKECYSENQTSEPEPTIVTKKGTVTKSIERPEEVTLPAEKSSVVLMLLIFLVIPILFLALVAVFSRYFYEQEVRRIKRGEKQASLYVVFIDKNILAHWFVIRERFNRTVLSNRIVRSIVEGVGDVYYSFAKGMKKFWRRSVRTLKRFGIIREPKPKLFNIPYYNLGDVDDRHLYNTIAVSCARYLVKKMGTKDIIGKITSFTKDFPKLTIAEVGAALGGIGLRVEYADNKIYKKGDQYIENIKSAMKAGVKYNRQKYTLEELKRFARKRYCVIIEIIVKEKNRFVNYIVPISGYDNKNIMIHDYHTKEKNRKVKDDLLEVAWKNAHFRTLIVRK